MKTHLPTLDEILNVGQMRPQDRTLLVEARDVLRDELAEDEAADRLNPHRGDGMDQARVRALLAKLDEALK